MKKILYIIFVSVWIGFLSLCAIFYISSPSKKDEFSKEENRILANFPEVSFDNIISGDFGNSIEAYFLDHFPKRNLIIDNTAKVKDFMSIATYDEYLAISPKVEDPLDNKDYLENIDDLINDLINNKPDTDDDSDSDSEPDTDNDTQTEYPAIVEKQPGNINDFSNTMGIYMNVNNKKTALYTFSRDSALAITGVLNKYAALLPTGGKLMFTVVPQSANANLFVNSSKNGEMYSEYDELVNAFGSNNVYAFDAAQILTKAIKQDKYVYFRTDMHWTPYGSYLVYCEMAKRAGKTPCNYTTDFDITIEEPFLGTYYRDNPTSYMRENADKLELLMPKCTFEWRRIVSGDEYKTIDFLNFNAKANDRYTVYLGGPAGPWTYTMADNGETENCLVITDSFGLGYIPFLVGNYKEVHYYDPRYFNKNATGANLTQLIEKHQIRDIYVVVGDLHSFDSSFILNYALNQLQ